MWEWELGRYGIDLSQPDFVRSRRRRFRLSRGTQATMDEIYYRRLPDWDWSPKFPVVPEAVVRADQLGLLDGSGYAAIHLRRGDYLRVSSRVVRLEESIGLASRITGLLPRRIVILSDDAISQEERSEIRRDLPDGNILFIDEPDQHVAHGLLRMATLLITSNSTFSWTAAMLTVHDEGIALAPQRFFGPSMGPVNRIFQSPVSWMLMSRALRP